MCETGSRGMRLENKVALITGAASGIGRATAARFAEEGAKVVIADVDREGGESAAGEIRSHGGVAHFVTGDVSREQDVERMIRTALDRHGRLDVLVNNAGRGEEACALTETEERDWISTFDVNLKGVFFACKHALRAMTEAGGGVIVNIGSIAGLEGAPFMGPYGASKAGVISLSRTLALEYGPMGVRVSCICPGAIETPLLRRALEKLPVDGIDAYLTAQIPLRRIGSPQDVAAAALFLASEEAAYVSGAVLTVDGAFSSGKSGP